MHAERDVIMNRVFPAVSQILAPKQITLQFIDLRWGVNTQDIEENERENFVLQECLSEIETSRPFFIGLLGNRYGWIPPTESWDNVVNAMSETERRFIHAESSTPKSVTELEILFGALIDRNFLRRSLFCFRAEEVYDKMDDASVRKYCDSDEETKNKLLQLKQKITDAYQNTGHETNLYQYTCDWDGRQLTKLDGLGEFLTESIVKEVLLYECSDATINPGNEFHQLQGIDHEKIERSNNHFLGREKTLQELLAFCTKNNTRPLIIVSHCGFGKTALLCKLWSLLDASDEFIPLIHFTDKGQLNNNPVTMLKKWLADERLGYDKYFSMDQDVEFSELVFHFKKASKSCTAKKKIVLLVDDLQLTEYPETVIDFSWLPDNAAIIATSDRSWPLLSAGNVNGDLMMLDGLTAEEAREMMEALLKMSGKSLPAAVMDTFLSFSYEGFRSSSCPLWNTLMTRKLTRLSSDDYLKIKERPERDEALKIQNYLTEAVNKSHPHPEPLFLSLIEDSSHFVDFTFTWHLAKFIAASEKGLRESDLQILMKDIWDSLAFTSVKHWLGELITTDPRTGLIDFAYEGYRNIMRMPTESMLPYYQALLDHLGHLRDEVRDDAVANNEMPYLALKLKEGRLSEYLLSDIDSELYHIMVRALSDYLLSDQETAAAWCNDAFTVAPLNTLHLVTNVAERIIVLGQRKLADQLLRFALGCITDKTEDEQFAYELDRVRVNIATLAADNNDREISDNLSAFVLNTGFDKRETDSRYAPLLIKAARIQANILFNRNEEAALKMTGYLINELEEQIHTFDKTELLDDLASAYSLLSMIYSKKEVNDSQNAQNYFMARFSGEPWALAHYNHFDTVLRQAGFLSLAHQSFAADLLFNEVISTAEELTSFFPDNILLFTAMVQSKLCTYSMKREEEDHSANVRKWLTKLSEYNITETVDMSVQCLLYLYRMNNDDFTAEKIADIVQNSIDLDMLQSSGKARYMATLYQIITIFSSETDDIFSETTASEALAIAEELLLMRNDPQGASCFIDFYNKVKKNASPSDALEIRSNVLKCIAAAGRMDYDSVLDYYDTVVSFIKKIPTAESFIAVNDYLRLWCYVRQDLSEVSMSRVTESYQIFSDMLAFTRDNDMSFSTSFRLQLCFYNLCSQAELNIMPLLRSGQVSEAQRLFSQLKGAVTGMKKRHYSGTLVLTAYSLAYGLYTAYFEEMRQLQEALYYARQHEYAVYENHHRFPGDWELKRRYAGASDNTGRLFITFFHSPDEAEKCFDIAFRLFRELYEEKKSGIILNDMLISAHNIMMVLHIRHEHQKAVEFAEATINSLDISDASVETRVIASLYDDMSDHYTSLGDFNNALRTLSEAQKIFTAQLEKEPGNELYLRDFAQNAIRIALFLWEKNNDTQRALEIMTQVDEKLQKAESILDSSIKIRQMYIYLLYRQSQLLIICGKMKEAESKLTLFINLCYQEVKNQKNLSIVQFLWEGLNMNFNEAIKKGGTAIATDITAIELKLKREFIREKIIREEEALLEETMQKFTILEEIRGEQNQ